jgi:hypothetical protein
MSTSSSAGISATWAATRPDSSRQAVDLSMLKQQAKAEEGVVELLESAAEQKKSPAPPPPGQGRHVDVRA